ncbi:MAG: tetratricopeptide repeat protein [Rhodothermales bacterium]|nr:tetratricopeptide repeat protein [Rhodothermales bacterium]
MSTLKPTKKISRRHELREDKVVTLYAKALEFIDANKPIVYGTLAAVIVFFAAIIGFNYLQGQKQQRAIVEMASAVRDFEQGNYQEALDGADGTPGLIEIIDEFGGTDAGNLARFYAADSYFRLGQYDDALTFFQSYKIEEDYIGASALAGEAAVYELRGDFDRAGDLYTRAARIFESEVTSPGYLLDAARAYVQAGNIDDAMDAYETITTSYADTPEAQQVDILKAQAIVKAS